MKSIALTGQQKCIQCIKCLKACPVDAISIVDHQVHINNDKCIHCGICIKECSSRVLKVQNVHLSDTLHCHDYNVILIPTSLLSDMKSYDEFEKINAAILKLGFDEIVQYSDIEGFLYKKAIQESQDKAGIWLMPFCPTINRLIEKNYPTLYERLLPYDYPVEIAARQIRKRLKDKNVGIYSLCECVAKMTLARFPFDNEHSQIDYALTISHIFPKINKYKNEDRHMVKMNKYGIKSNVEDLFGNRSLSVLSIEGLNQTKNLLELLEFDRIHHVDLIAMYACYQGCIGGYYLWSNPYEGCYNIESMMAHYSEEMISLTEDEYLISRHFNCHEMESIKEKMERFVKVNNILEQLPQFDCGACGFANCRTMAQAIVDGKVSIQVCRVKKG